MGEPRKGARLSRPSVRHSLAEPAQRHRVAPLDVSVRPVEQLEPDDRLADPEPLELGPECLGGEIEVEVVAATGVDPDRAQRAQRIGPFGGHADGVPCEPSVPDLGPDTAGGWLEWQL